MINEIITYLTIIFGTAMSFSWFFQVRTMYKNKSAENVSKIFILIAGISITLFLIQGILTRDPVLYVPFIVGFTGIWTVVFTYFKFRKK